MRTHKNNVKFSIVKSAAWAPGVDTELAWQTWAHTPHVFALGAEPKVATMQAMLRRRAGFLGKMALEVAYQCLDDKKDIPTVFCSRHGDVGRAVELLNDLVQSTPLSPTGFSLAVHNATAGLFSIARQDKANHLALASGSNTIENALIDACSLLADGAPMVLVVVCDQFLPEVFKQFHEGNEQPYAWAWLIVQADTAHNEVIELSWENVEVDGDEVDANKVKADAESMKVSMSAGLEILRFYLTDQISMKRAVGKRRWLWTRYAA